MVYCKKAMKPFSIIKNWINLLILPVVMFCIFAQSVSAYSDTNRSYTFDEWQNSVESPSGYEPSKVIFANDMGVDFIDSPEDFAVDNNNIYILDTGNRRVVILDKNYKLVKLITEFTLNGIKSPILNPKSIFVDANGIIYIADTANSRIISLNQQGVILKEFKKPTSELYPQKEEFRPKKVLVDEAGIVYGICTNIFNGAVMYSANGDFLGFYGSNRVEMSVGLLVDRFWKSIFYKEENQDTFKNYIPVEYTSFDIDSEGFIYTCTSIATSPENLIRKLNSTSINIFDGLVENSFQKGFGDLNPSVISGQYIQSKFIDISVDRDGFINCLDFERGRIFQYSQDTNLMFAFGGLGSVAGGFVAPTAIEKLDDKILVLDNGTNSITEFKLTEFGKKVHIASNLFNQGKYVEAIKPWQDVIKFNSNYNLAYIGIGKAELELGNNVSAMANFKIGKYTVGYDQAFKEQRTIDTRANFTPIILIVILLLLMSRLRKQEKVLLYYGKTISALDQKPIYRRLVYLKNQMGESFKIITHPIEGFNEFFYKKSGNLVVSCVLALLVFISLIFNTQFKGFSFNSLFRTEDMNVLIIFLQSIGLALLFAVVNWSLCTLFEGKGRVKNIWFALTYSSMPFIISLIAVTILSNFLVTDEGVFMTYILLIGQAYSVFLIIKGIEAAHHYSFVKSIIAIVATLVGMVLVIVLVILSFSLIQQIIGFVITVIREYSLRYR